MKLIYVFLLFLAMPLYAQPQDNCSVEVKEIVRISNYRGLLGWITKTNAWQRPDAIYCMDSTGLVLQTKWYYSYTHNLAYINQNTYEKGRLTLTTNYTKGPQHKFVPNYTTTYHYTPEGFLQRETETHNATAKTTFEVQYEYDSHGNKTRVIHSPGRHSEYAYDENSKIATVKDMDGDKLECEYTYINTDTLIIGNIKRYYTQGNNYNTQEIKRYSNGHIIEVVTKDFILPDNPRIYKQLFAYYKNGLLKSTTCYYVDKNNKRKGPKITEKYSITHKGRLSAGMIKKINDLQLKFYN